MDIYNIAKIITKNKGRLYFVGGYVRDKLLGIDSHDIDFCITDINEKTFINLFPQAIKIGKSFPVFKMDNCEFAFARTETKNNTGHNGFSMFTDNVTIEEDLLRRDISINSIAMDVLTQKIIDPTNGINDLNNKIIRANSKHFSEDALRAYRVARFAATLNFNVDENTIKLMNSTKEELYLLSAERVFDELKKALASNTPSIFFNTLRKANILDVHFIEIYNLIDVVQPLIYHPEGDVYNHSMITLDKASKLTENIEIRFCALTHDLGKATTPKNILPHHYGHDERGVELVRNICNRLKTPTSWKKVSKIVAHEHMKAGMFNEMNFNKKVSFMEQNFNFLDALSVVANVDSRENNIDFVSIANKMMQEINGKKIYLPNNIHAKEILHEKRVSWLKKNYASFLT